MNTKHRILCSLKRSIRLHSRSRFLHWFLCLQSSIKRNFSSMTRLLMANSGVGIHFRRLIGRLCQRNGPISRPVSYFSKIPSSSSLYSPKMTSTVFISLPTHPDLTLIFNRIPLTVKIPTSRLYDARFSHVASAISSQLGPLTVGIR